MKITIKRNAVGDLMTTGKHIGTIVSVEMDLSKALDAQTHWADQTPELKVFVRNAQGAYITCWLHLGAYKNSNDFPSGVAPKGFEFRSFNADSEKFLVEKKTNKRVASPERLEKMLAKVGNLASVAGIEGEDIDINDLVAELEGKEVGVDVRENNLGRVEVYNFLPAIEVLEAIEA